MKIDIEQALAERIDEIMEGSGGTRSGNGDGVLQGDVPPESLRPKPVGAAAQAQTVGIAARTVGSVAQQHPPRTGIAPADRHCGRKREGDLRTGTQRGILRTGGRTGARPPHTSRRAAGAPAHPQYAHPAAAVPRRCPRTRRAAARRAGSLCRIDVEQMIRKWKKNSSLPCATV